MGFGDWFTSNKDGDTGGMPWLTNFSHNVTDKIGLPDPWNQLYGDPAKKQKAALMDASAKMQALADSERARQYEGLKSAMGSIAKTQAVYNNIYGDPGTMKIAPYGGKMGGK